MAINILRPAFFLIIKFLVFILLGMNVRRKYLLPIKGPAVIVANHNSHLDTLALMSLFPVNKLSKIHPIAAADYFLKNKFLTWFATKIIGIIPIERDSAKSLQVCYQALDNEQIVILFPEGTRGEAEQISQFKRGVAHIAEHYPNVPVIPVFMHGLGKALPKGDWVLIPFFCDVLVGNAIFFKTSREEFMDKLNESFSHLSEEGNFAAWE